MSQKIRNSVAILAFFLTVSGLFFGLCAEAGWAGVCEDAAFRCMGDPFMQATFFGIIYCSMGYAFCKKYVEPAF